MYLVTHGLRMLGKPVLTLVTPHPLSSSSYNSHLTLLFLISLHPPLLPHPSYASLPIPTTTGLPPLAQSCFTLFSYTCHRPWPVPWTPHVMAETLICCLGHTLRIDLPDPLIKLPQLPASFPMSLAEKASSGMHRRRHSGH